jgi:endonuclease-3
MHTSRISRDTSRILAASRTQRTLRQSRTATNVPNSGPQRGIKAEEEAENSRNVASDSELSSVPESSPEDEAYRASMKRKRGQDAPKIVKQEVQETSIAAITSPKKGAKVKKARRAPAKKIKGGDGSLKVEPPANWEEIYALTREMRNANIAPVDTMGCESLADKNRTPRDQRFQTLIALMLSSQTKDTVTAPVMRGMQENMPGVPLPLQYFILAQLTHARDSTSNPSSRSNLPPSTPS